MKSATVSAVYLAAILCAALLAPVAAQELPVILEVQQENLVVYVDDVTDPSRVARTPGPVPVNVGTTPVNFYANVVLGDVTAVNGSPAKGLVTNRGNGIQVTPTPNPGQSIGDVIRGGYWQFAWEFLKPDGSPIGSIFAAGFPGNAAAPGSPPGAGAGNISIVGGTGAFLGARGTVNQVAGGMQRPASIAEDPSMRRINGGGRNRVLFQLFPMFRPEVLIGPNGPVIIHADYTAITADKPARPGEVLILYAKGLGPTTPSVNPGDPYPREPFAIVTSPVEVLVNGKPSPAINQIGLPGTTDIYHVAFRVPDDTGAGTARVQISAAWVKGSAVSIPVR